MIVDDLRNTGPDPLCERAADEIESLEAAYASLFKENAAHKARLDAIFHPENQPSQYGTCTLEWHQAQRAALLAERPDVAGAIALCRRSLDRDETTLTAEQALASQCLSTIESLAAQLAERERELAEARKDAEFRLEAQSRESEEARFYRYLRDEAGQLPDDHDGPVICSGLGDNFDFLRGEECDIEIRAAIAAMVRP